MKVVSLLWSIPLRIVKHRANSILNLDSRDAETTKRIRRRPLHTCGASCLAIAHKACTKAQDLNPPLGSIAKWAIFLTHYLTPIIYAMLYQWLAMLSLIDDQILTVQTITEKIIPSSTHLFDKIDGLVHSVEILPENLDRLFPFIAHKFPVLDWIVVRLIACLNSILSILANWGSSSSSSDHTREKEITIDVMNRNDIIIIERRDKSEDEKRLSIEPPMKRLQSLKDRIKGISEHHQNCAVDSPLYSSYHSANSSPVSDLSAEETYPFNMTNCSYKEMLERGTKEEDDAKDKNAMLEKGTKEDDDAKGDYAKDNNAP